MVNQEIKAQWTAALRSGEYTQATNCLKNGDGFCCLGVLTDLYVKSGVDEYDLWMDYPGFDTWDEVLPIEVQRWSGMESAEGSNPEWDLDWEIDRGFRDLAFANDMGKSFAEIADLIDEYF